VRITISKENYLKAIAEAESEGEAVKAVTLRRWLGVSAPAVTMAVKRLKRDGLIEVQGEGQIELTGAGREIANRLLNRHHLIERMLTEIFGLEWYKVHEEAEQLEHAVSADFENKLSEKLGPAGLCPHGNLAAMDSPERRRARGLVPLGEAEAGECVRVTCLFERDRVFLERMDGLGVRPGARLRVEASAHGEVRLEAAAGAVAMDAADAARVWVARVQRSG
jgi:DtxR family Mn-dependent transcriptional regulator